MSNKELLKIFICIIYAKLLKTEKNKNNDDFIANF